MQIQREGNHLLRTIPWQYLSKWKSSFCKGAWRSYLQLDTEEHYMFRRNTSHKLPLLGLVKPNRHWKLNNIWCKSTKPAATTKGRSPRNQKEFTRIYSMNKMNSQAASGLTAPRVGKVRKLSVEMSWHQAAAAWYFIKGPSRVQISSSIYRWELREENERVRVCLKQA